MATSRLHNEFFAHHSWGIEVAVDVYNSSADSFDIEGFAGDFVEIKGFSEVKELKIDVVVYVAV
jgi:hypothetical protein